jgi:hypothetical protein
MKQASFVFAELVGLSIFVYEIKVSLKALKEAIKNATTFLAQRL